MLVGSVSGNQPIRQIFKLLLVLHGDHISSQENIGKLPNLEFTAQARDFLGISLNALQNSS